MSDNGYAAACIAAATQQGLDPVTERLHLETIHYEVEQTGGFCMVVVVPDRGDEVGVWGITEDEPGTYLLCYYPENTWNEGGEAVAVYEGQTLDQVVAHLTSETVRVDDGTTGQDRESYTDDQDRDDYRTTP